MNKKIIQTKSLAIDLALITSMVTNIHAGWQWRWPTNRTTTPTTTPATPQAVIDSRTVATSGAARNVTMQPTSQEQLRQLARNRQLR